MPTFQTIALRLSLVRPRTRKVFNPLTQELNPSAQRSTEIFLLGILIFKGLTARRLYKSFGVIGLRRVLAPLRVSH
jgi:hypothetical protein